MTGDKTATELTALHFIGWHGDEAPYVLSEYAEAATNMGDAGSAKTWNEIATAAARLLKSGWSPLPGARM